MFLTHLLTRKTLISVISILLMLLSSIGQVSYADTEVVPPQPPKNITIDYNNASLPAVLKGIAYSYGLNIIIGKDVTGQVSAQLKDIPFDDALRAILWINGYDFTRKDNIIYVVPKAEMEQGHESIQLSYILAKDARGLLLKALSARGDIQANEATNTLIITDYQENLRQVKKLIKDIDVPPIQVLIEARIVDLKNTDYETLGTSLSTTFSGNSRLASTLTTGTVSSLIEGSDGGTLNLVPQIRNLSADLTIDALVQEHRARVLASPSIATLSGHEARIIIGNRIPYTAQTATTGSTSTVSTQFLEVGTTLRVTPLVSPDGFITMKVHPEVSVVLDAPAGQTPAVSTREADATVRVRDNETIIIGGLIERDDKRDKNGVPVLRSIPILGWFFQRHTSDKTNSELTVFITPHILRSPAKKVIEPDGMKTEGGGPKVEVRLLNESESPSKAGQENISSNESGRQRKPENSPEVYINSEDYEQDQDLLAGFMNYAKGLQRDIENNPTDSLYLSMELIKTYRSILQQFPHSQKGGYCLYKISEIYAREFGRCDAAKEELKNLKKMYPESPYISEAESAVKFCVQAARRDEQTMASLTGD